MDAKTYLLALYRDYLNKPDDRHLKDNNPLKFKEIFLSYRKNKNGLYSLFLFNVSNLVYYGEEIYANVSLNDAIRFTDFLKHYFELNNGLYPFYGVTDYSLVDDMKLYLMVNSICSLDFSYDDLDEFMAMHDATGYAFTSCDKESYSQAIINDERRANSTTTLKVEELLNKANSLSDEFKRTYLKALIKQDPYEVYQSLNKEDQTKLLDLYYDQEVLDLDLYIDNYYKTMNPHFNILLYNRIKTKMYSSEVGKACKSPAKYAKSPTNKIHSLNLVLYDNMVIDLNSKKFVYRTINLTDEQLINLFALNGIQLQYYDDAIKNQL